MKPTRRWWSPRLRRDVIRWSGCGTGRAPDANVHAISRREGNARIGPEPREDLVQRSAPFLPAGEEIRQAFIYQSASNSFFFIITYLTGLTIVWNKYRCVAVTQAAIYVLESSKLSGGGSPQRLLGTLPRHIRLGPVSGRWAQVSILGERGWVHQRFHDQVAAADHDSGFPQ
jgi:predicted DNA-binding transcriptional regulator AlpA